MNNDKYDYTLEENQSKMDKPQFYSQGQIYVCALLCGILPAVWMLRRNFLTIGESEKASATLFWGSVISLLVIEVILFLPESFPDALMPAVISVVAGNIAGSTQKVQLDELLKSGSVKRIPHGKALLMSVILFVVTIALIFALSYLTELVMPAVSG